MDVDNPATHKVAGMRETIESAGARLKYLPPYSPDFSPIEPMWTGAKKPATTECLPTAHKAAEDSIFLGALGGTVANPS